MVSLRPATAADIVAVYGKPLNVSTYGITGTEGGQVLGVGAIFPSDGCWLIVCNLRAPVRSGIMKYSKALLRAARQLQALAARHHMPMRAVLDPQQPRAAALLEHLGFRHLDKDVYEWTIPA